MIGLRKVDNGNVWEICSLKVKCAQKDFVASNVESLAEAFAVRESGGVALPFGIYDDDVPVGFVMLGYDLVPGETDMPEIAKGNYCIWRFMIDEKFQRKGFGRQALQLVLDYIKTFPCGKAEAVYLSYEPENTGAAALYHAFGFKENGEKDGDEIVAVLWLN